jgi:pyruvate dehydrogenase E2 component (dihydrolipoamide acetyltransferase)
VKVGDKVDEGAVILMISADVEEPAIDESAANESVFVNEPEADSGPRIGESQSRPVSGSAEPLTTITEAEIPPIASEVARPGEKKLHAGPSVRKQAREYGLDLAEIEGTGKFGRVIKDDVIAYIKSRLSGQAEMVQSNQGGIGIPEIPEIDFSKFGEVEVVARSRIRQATARNLHRSWLNVPHVTQFDQADITDLELFRKAQNSRLADQGIKVTPLAFFIKAVVSGLQKYPQFNASLHPDGASLILKKYINIGVAVETEDGLVVPVIKNADKKGLLELAAECADLADNARQKSLSIDSTQGATFTISSLGGIGGTSFTPIVNAPEVAILGVSRTRLEAVFDGAEFMPRRILPLSLSYDHRAIDGAEAARFTDHLSLVLSDTRLMLL